MGFRKLLASISKRADDAVPAIRKTTSPEILDEADNLLPTIRKNTLPDEVPVEVLGKGKSKVSDIVEDIPDAEFGPIKGKPISNMDALIKSAKENPKIAALLTSIAGGTAFNSLNGGGDEQPPMMTPPPLAKKPDESVVNENEVPAVAPIKAPTAELSATDQARAGMDKFMANIPEDKQPEAAPVEGPNFLKMIEEGQKKQERELLDAKWLRASELLGGGLARIKPDHGSSDLTRKGAERFGEQAKAKVGAVKEQQGYDKAQTEINDEKALRDPNSAISKQTKEQLAKYGINVNTALEAKQLNPQIFNLLMADRAQKNAKEVAAMGLESTKNKLSTTLDEKQRKFAQGLRKEATTGVLGKQYATFSTGQRMSSSLSDFAKNPSGYKDYATLMGGLKTLQGDESVVREAEVRMGMSATSAIDSAMNHLQKLSNGKMLQPSQRKEMIDTIQILTEASRKQYMQSVAPILEQAQMEGIDPSVILSGSLQGADKEGKSSESQGLTTSGNTRTFKSNQTPGSIVTVKSGKKYKIGSDGVTGTEI